MSYSSTTYRGDKVRCDIRITEKKMVFLISNISRVLYVVYFLLGNSPASEF